jgi:hypothetical protein
MVDGHAEAMKPDELDGRHLSADGQPNNAWWKGQTDPSIR